MTRFVKIDSKSRRYIDTETGEEISRRQYEKRRGKPLPKPKPSKVPKLSGYGVSTTERLNTKAERDAYFKAKGDTHRWFATSTQKAPQRMLKGRATWGYQLLIVAAFENEKTGVIREGVMGASFVHNDYIFVLMHEEAIREAQSRLGGSGWIHLETTDAYVREWRHLKRTRENYRKYETVEAFKAWEKRRSLRGTSRAQSATA